DQDNATSKRISIGRRLFGEKTILRMTYGTGFKHPSLFQLYSSFGNTTLESESSQSFDLSWEQSLTTSLKGTIDYFRNTYKNLIDFDTATSKYMNVSAADTDGVEVQGQFEPVSGNGVRAVYTYLHTHDETTGQRLLRRAQNSATLIAYVQAQKFSGAVQYRYVGDREDIDPVSYARVKNPSYDVVHLQANYQLVDSFKISMRIQNLLDRQYEEILGYGTAGRSFYIGLSN
ncbi:MAG: TonB-dependent receptor domain-containing protein, partial [Bdellovibrio sp.]